MIQKNTIIQGDCIDVMHQIPSNSIDMIFADPPYFMQLSAKLHRPDTTKVNAVNDIWDKFDDYFQYDMFTLAWLIEARRVLKPNGSLWVIGSYHNIFRIGYLLQTIGFWILNDITWIKTNPMPNFMGTRLSNAHETLIWCTKEKTTDYTFNYEGIKAFNDDTQMRSDWYLPICGGKERLKTSDGLKVHSTQKPLALLRRILLTATRPNDLILDPFFGTGTTGAVAKELGRNFIGIEQNPDYIPHALKRIQAVCPIPFTYLGGIGKKPIHRVTFGMLIENGLLKPGDVLKDKEKKHIAIVQADASLKMGWTTLSFQKMALHCQNNSEHALNGWHYWHRHVHRKMIPLDHLRTELKNRLFPLKNTDTF